MGIGYTIMDSINENTYVVIETENTSPSDSIVRAVRIAARRALCEEGALQRYACVVLTDDDTIHACNRDYRGVDRATDVLSFPADEGDELLAPPDGFLGDIMISVPTAERQGMELSHSAEREIAFLTVHGILHLLGYDHIEPEDEKLMLEKQRRIMSFDELKAL